MASVAKCVVTPQTNVWLAGYGSKRSPDGKIHDLWLKVLALAIEPSAPLILITSDFQGVPKSMSDRVFARLQSDLHIARSQVMFTFSHNHCGPRLGDDLIDYYPFEAEQESLVESYTDAMVELTIQTVRQALLDLAPASLATTKGQTHFAVNRRNNPEAEVPRMLAQSEPFRGPVDHDVPVLIVTREPDEPLAILFGYACHPTTLSFNTWCGDYPGFAQQEIEQQFPGATAMFVNTCGGDQNPLPRRSLELCRKYGRMLSDAVVAAMQLPRTPLAAELHHAFTMIDLPYLEVVSRQQLQSLASDNNAIRARWASRLLKRLDDGQTFEASYPYPLHVWRLGTDTLFIGMGAETVVDYALHFKKIYGTQTWVCGYTDDMISYIPSRRVWEEGGYEGGANLFEYGRPALRWSGNIEQQIHASVDLLVNKIYTPK